jgi:hypothetical protein
MSKTPIEISLAASTVPATPAEARMAAVIYDQLTNNAMGKGLTVNGGGGGEDGRQVVEVAGCIDLIALARRVLAAAETEAGQPRRRPTKNKRA